MTHAQALTALDELDRPHLTSPSTAPHLHMTHGRDRAHWERKSTRVVESGARGPDPAESEHASIELVGREVETSLVRRLVDRIDAMGGAVIVRGAPGVGKSAMLRWADSYASSVGARVLRVGGSAAECSIFFSGLHSLLQPLLADVGCLPGPQRAAILSAFGMAEPAIVEPFVVALGALGLLTHASTQRPVVMVVDDTERLDRATREVLAFVGRRLSAERIVLVMSRVDEPQPFPHFDLELSAAHELRLSDLADDAAHRLVDACAPRLSSLLRTHVLSLACGNPGVIEGLGSALVTTDQNNGAVRAAVEVPLGPSLMARCARTLSGLPASTRQVLLLAACDDCASIDDVVAAAASAGMDVDSVMSAIAPAVDAEVVVLDSTRLAFTHPLLRSAVYQGESLAVRHAAHAALAAVSSESSRRRAWHRALSTSGPSDEVAAGLHLAGEAAQSRGSMMEALMAFDRAARLTTSAPARARSLHAAARAAFELGWADVANELLSVHDVTRPGAHSPTALLARRTVDDVRTDSHSDVAAAIGELVSYSLVVNDRAAARRVLFRAAVACLWIAPDSPVTITLATATRGLELAVDDPWRMAIVAMVGTADERATVSELLGRVSTANVHGTDAACALGVAATAIGRDDLAVDLLSRAVDGFRAEGRLVLLAQALVLRASAAVALSHFDLASSTATEGAAVASRTSQPLWEARAVAITAFLAAMKGDDDGVRRMTAETDRRAAQRSGTAALADAARARGHCHLANGRFTEAARELAGVFTVGIREGTTSQQLAAIADFAEASQRAGQTAAARDAIAQLCRTVPAAITTHRAEIAYANALLVDDEDSEAHFTALLDRRAGLSPFLRARCYLALGTMLRRLRRTVESRDHLNAAITELEALGATRWAERATQELRATGEHRRNGFDSRVELTPQEALVAQLASTGLSNHQIAQRLSLSPRTVGAHLYRVFPKLGVTSRGELHRALSDVLDQTAAAG